MPTTPRATSYANPATCWAYRHERPDLVPLDLMLEDVDGAETRPLLPDGVILIVGSDMSVVIDTPGGPLPFRATMSPHVRPSDVYMIDQPEGQTAVLALGLVRELAPGGTLEFTEAADAVSECERLQKASGDTYQIYAPEDGSRFFVRKGDGCVKRIEGRKVYLMVTMVGPKVITDPAETADLELACQGRDTT
jgi:hypothetical protein